MKKLMFIVVIFVNIITIAKGQPVIYTPTGSSVDYDYEEEMSQAQIEVADTYWQGRIDENYWEAEIIGSSSTQYNCHSYAFHVSDEGNLVWINSPANYYSGASPTYVSSTNTEDSLRKIVYDYDYGGHSAISTNTEDYVVSKWGAGPLVYHAIDDWPWLGGSLPDADFYEIEIDGDDDVEVGGTITQTTLNISGATYNWSGDGYYICGEGTSYEGTIVGLIETPLYTKAPVTVEITSTYSNTTVKGDIKDYIIVDNYADLPTISAAGGSRLVCSSGLAFTVNGLPSGWTIVWTCGSYLTRSSAQGSNPCTFSSTGNGSSWVDAIVYPSCGGSFPLSQYNVWSGKPILNVSGPYEGYVGNTYPFYANPSTYSSPTDYEWILNPLLDNEVNDYGNMADIEFYDAYETYQVVSRAKNTCSSGAWGDYSVAWIDIYEDEEFFMSPNPASELITIIKQQSSELVRGIEEINMVYTIRIIDLYGNLQYSTKKSGMSFTIPVINLIDGNYFVQIINNKKVSNLKLVIKR